MNTSEKGLESAPRFIADSNVGRLARWLRMMGYDTVFFDEGEDSLMVARALAENRILLTRDTEIMKRRLVTSGRLKAVLIATPKIEPQLRQVIDALHLDYQFKPFTLCLECNRPLVGRSQEEVKDRVPQHVLKTQSQYMECPTCRRVYWRGTHWQAMTRRLKKLMDKSREA